MKLQTAFVLIFLANVVLDFVSLAILPSRVAIHFGFGGLADNWTSNQAGALFFLGIQILLFCSVYFSPRLIFKSSPKWINLPNKEYWLKPENKERTAAMVTGFMWRFGMALFLFLFVAQLLSIQANLSRPVRLTEKLFLSALGLFLIYTIYWCIMFVRSFRVSKK